VSRQDLEYLSPPPGGAAVTIGTFDGVHLGHQALLRRTLEVAGEGGATPIALTWDRHPVATLRPGAEPPLLTSQARKLELLAAQGLDVAVLAFDRQLSSWSPERFVETVLLDRLRARAVVVGRGWRFGHRAAGDVGLLRRLGEAHGFTVHAPALTEARGGPVSSSRVRQALAEGKVEIAGELLGRPFDFDGEVIHGEKRGAALGFPTANLAVDRRLARPGRGIYAGRARVSGAWHKAAISIGVNPQFGGEPGRSPERIEAFLVDYEGDLYGTTVRLEVPVRLRDERAFASVDELVAQMGLDVEAARAIGC
jgi:riboflavin kinase / FMN adenylyltransferase